MKSLRTKMTLMIIMVVLGSSLMISFISYQRARMTLISQLEDNYEVAAQKYALELTSWVNTNATIIDTMAAEIAVNDITLKDYDEFHNYLKHSNELLNKNGYVYDVYFTYPDNTMVCASDFIADGSVDFVHEREWYTTSALTGELFYAAPYLDSDTNRSVITISKAVYKDDELLGVLAADIFVDVLIDKINNANVEEGNYAFLIDQNMRMISHPNTAYAYTDYPLYVTDVPDTPYKPLLDAISADESDEMIFVKDYDGVTRGITFSKMTNTGWIVCLATSKKVLEKDVVNLMLGFVIATLVSLAIGIIVAIILARVMDRLNKQEQEYKEQVLKLEKQAADEASEAKSRFLADMSHEIRTPINAIIGMNEMILRESDSKEIKGYSQNIKQSGKNLLQLINGILDFSKIEDGKMEIVPARYSLSSQIAYLINSVSDRAKSKNLELIFNIDPNLPSELYGDDTRINQVIINLLTNAVKYTEQGSVTLTMEERQRDEEGGILIYVEIKDTGIGIKESDMARLFESFERLDVVKNRNIEGTGLGMTITRKLLDLMGSELKVESEYGKGSTFSFEILQQIENDEPVGDYKKAIAEIGENDSYRESFRAPKARILVVDDTQMNIFVIENLLKKTQINIDTALNGPDSIALCDKNEYDVILMDQRMPGMDGTEAMNAIRTSEIGKNNKTTIICLTADVIRGAKDRYLNMGFDDYLTKPVESADLEKMLVKYIPDEKVDIIDYEPEAGADDFSKTSGNGLNAVLEKAGVNVNTGLEYTGNDETMYQSVVFAFALESKEKKANLQKSFDEKDWKNYGVYIHSLKSSAKMIGAMKLSEKAAGLEASANASDGDSIIAKHDRVMKEYEELVDTILPFANEEKSDEINKNTDGSKEDDEIFEFLPSNE